MPVKGTQLAANRIGVDPVIERRVVQALLEAQKKLGKNSDGFVQLKQPVKAVAGGTRTLSLFEVGNPDKKNGIAVSVRYFPEWGDEYAKILLIKNRGKSAYDYVNEQLPPVHPGSVISFGRHAL